jgi:hypothetical protein
VTGDAHLMGDALTIARLAQAKQHDDMVAMVMPMDKDELRDLVLRMAKLVVLARETPSPERFDLMAERLAEMQRTGE